MNILKNTLGSSTHSRGSNHSLSSVFSISSSNPDLVGTDDSQGDEFGGDSPDINLPVAQLEAIADMLQEKLNNDGFVQDRQTNSKTVTQAFFGADLVSLLQDLLKDHLDGQEVLRSQSLQVGRQMQSQFQLFIHSKSTKSKQLPLLDSQTDLYQFHHNLPMQVYQVRRLYPSHWDKVKLLEQEVTLGTHKGITKNFEETFLAKEAVDVLMELKLVRSRKEGVHMIRKLNEKVHCCRLASHPGNDGTKFKDDDSIYCFVAAEKRVPEPVKRKGGRRPSLIFKGMPSRQNTQSFNEATAAAAANSIAGSKKSSSSSSKIRKTKSSLDMTPALKDKTYFKQRVGSLRSQLDVYRQERFQAQQTNEQKNFVWNMAKVKREPSTSPAPPTSRKSFPSNLRRSLSPQRSRPQPEEQQQQAQKAN